MEEITKSKTALQRLTVSAMLLAVSVVFGFFKIPITQTSEIRLQFLPVALEGMLFGPLYGGILGGLSDILCYLVRPTGAFFPGFTISAILQGIIYGVVIKKTQSIPRIVAAQAADCILVSLILTPIWLMMLYGNGFIPIFIGRLPKVLIMFPVNIALLVVVTRATKRFMNLTVS